MTNKLKKLAEAVTGLMGEHPHSLVEALGELTLEMGHTEYFAVMERLRDHLSTHFDELIDLCGVDYLTYQEDAAETRRFAVVVHLLSVSNNHRLRVRVFAPQDDMPILPSVTSIWPAADWYEREAFDLFGILFDGHHDLRRILTDYGFIGHPFRKDFPISGYVEMRYDEAEQRVIYQPVTIEPRENTPRLIRQGNMGKTLG